ncbi:tetraspanin-18-like [Clavelina lepadiformis]|uniref:Tetraspanin n=1 Tax=Clavelina lepadiformis TaxID=159417 RepID=A0ABP0EXJ5_CLALP
METCGQKCLKYLMFIFNFLFFLCGGALLGVGIWVVVDGQSFMQIVASNPVIFSASYILIAVGAALLVISFLGCCGAIKENRCLLGTFFAIVLIIFIVEIVGAILAFVFYPDVSRLAKNTLNEYNENIQDNGITQGWNTLQSVVGCCGFDSPDNWGSSNWTKLNSAAEPRPFPASCCVRDTLSLSGTIRNETSCFNMESGFYHTLGCESKFQQYFWVLGGVGIGILVVELLAMIFTCCLYRAIGEEGNYA